MPEYYRDISCEYLDNNISIIEKLKTIHEYTILISIVEFTVYIYM